MSYEAFISTYSRATGIPLEYNSQWHDSWCYLFLKRYDADDLVLVAKHIKATYPNFTRQMLAFGFLVKQLDRFGELLAEAKARHRPRTERDKVLEATGRIAEKPDVPAQAVREVLRKLSHSEVCAGFRGILDSLK